MTRPLRLSWRPSLPALAFGLSALAAPLMFPVRFLNGDGDIARHLRHGEVILRAGDVIRADPFSYTMHGQPFVGFEYGMQVVMALAHRIAGLAGITILGSLLIGAAYGLLARFLVKRGVDPRLAFVVTVAAALLGMWHWVARPHLVTFIAIVLLLDLLERERPAPRWAFALLFFGWVNLHGGWVYGLALIGIYFVGRVAEASLAAGRIRVDSLARRYLSLFAIGAAASLLTPYGLGTPRHVIHHLFGDPYLFEATAEFMSPDFHAPGMKPFLVAILLMAALYAAGKVRPGMTHLLVILANLALALGAARQMAIFGLTAVPLLALQLNAALQDRSASRVRRPAGPATTWPWVAAATGLLLALGMAQPTAGGRALIPDRFDPGVFPVAAVDSARRAGLAGRIFHEFTWGGYLLYAWPEQQVFIDGGTDFYGGALLRTFQEIRAVGPQWREKLDQWRVSIALLDRNGPLAAELAREPGWRVWYRDSTAVILRREPGL